MIVKPNLSNSIKHLFWQVNLPTYLRFLVIDGVMRTLFKWRVMRIFKLKGGGSCLGYMYTWDPFPTKIERETWLLLTKSRIPSLAWTWLVALVSMIHSFEVISWRDMIKKVMVEILLVLIQNTPMGVEMCHVFVVQSKRPYMLI